MTSRGCFWTDFRLFWKVSAVLRYWWRCLAGSWTSPWRVWRFAMGAPSTDSGWYAHQDGWDVLQHQWRSTPKSGAWATLGAWKEFTWSHAGYFEEWIGGVEGTFDSGNPQVAARIQERIGWSYISFAAASADACSRAVWCLEVPGRVCR